MEGVDEETVQLLLLRKRALLIKKRQIIVGRVTKPTNRRYWVHPVNIKRQEHGVYTNLISELRNDEERFRKYMRMTPTSFYHLLNLIKHKIQKQDTQMRKSIDPGLKLAITLHHLAEGASHASVASHYRLGRSTTSLAIYETLDALWSVLQPIYLQPPSGPAAWKKVAEGFEKWNFPHCLGCIDGKHISIQKPMHCGSTYYNYKQRDSVVLMAICDADYKFLMVDIGKPGSCSDGGIWEASLFGRGLENGKINLPDPEMLPADERRTVPYWFVGDEAFPLRDYLMRPFPGRSLDSDSKRVFNYRLSRARRVIENTFGILAQRWRILFKMIIAEHEKVVKIVQGICVLHNFLQTVNDTTYLPAGFVDTPAANGEIREGFWRTQHTENYREPRLNRSSQHNGIAVREFLCEYLSGAGSVSWQMDIVNRR